MVLTDYHDINSQRKPLLIFNFNKIVKQLYNIIIIHCPGIKKLLR